VGREAPSSPAATAGGPQSRARGAARPSLSSSLAHALLSTFLSFRFYWAWNPDSGDVGGLLNPTDW